jgi:hypothetical protein
MSQFQDRLLDRHARVLPIDPTAGDPGEPAPARLVWLGVSFASVVTIASLTAFGLFAYGAKYVFKDTLGLDPDVVSSLSLLIDIPLFLSFIPGMCRDRWRPFGAGDRLTFLASSLAAACLSVVGGVVAPTTGRLVWILVAYSVMEVMVLSVANGQLALISKRLGLTGRIGTIIAVAPVLTTAALSPLTGYLIQFWGWRDLCLVSAGMSMTGLVVVVWQPRAILTRIARQDPTRIDGRPTEPLLQSVRRLLARREVALAAVVWALWEFTAGWGTPLFFHFTNDIKMTQSQYELTTTSLNLASAASAVGYAGLCLWFPTRRLLYLGIGVGVVGCVGYAFVTDFRSGIVVSALVGLTCGIGNTAIVDLVLRVTPRRLEAVSAMLAASGVALVSDLSDVIGSVLYQHGGFIAALTVTAVVNALDIPLLFLMPSRVFASPERTPVDDAITFVPALVTRPGKA